MACVAIWSVGVEAEADHVICEWKDIIGDQEQENY